METLKIGIDQSKKVLELLQKGSFEELKSKNIRDILKKGING